MIVILKESVSKEQVKNFSKLLESKYDIKAEELRGKSSSVLGLLGDTSRIDDEFIKSQNIVKGIKRVQEPYKRVSRTLHPQNTIITLDNGLKIGDGSLQVIAGPCSVESKDQIVRIAKAVKKSGASLLRGGAFKPRTSPYSFQGLGKEGLELLSFAKKETGLPTVTEITRVSNLDLFEDVDIIQVGARNMQNFELLKELGKIKKPILLKRGLSSTINELLMSAEYIMSSGNENVILCERGIRTYETFTRNTLDISAVPVLKRLSHLPIIVDPSHACGIHWLVRPLALSSIAAGADGLMIEVHDDPQNAMSDGPQSLTIESFERLSKEILKVKDTFAQIYKDGEE